MQISFFAKVVLFLTLYCISDLSIKNNNTYWGIVKGFDRILRCNNHASYYFDNHTVDPKYSIDERMIDKLNLKY